MKEGSTGRNYRTLNQEKQHRELSMEDPVSTGSVTKGPAKENRTKGFIQYTLDL